MFVIEDSETGPDKVFLENELVGFFQVALMEDISGCLPDHVSWPLLALVHEEYVGEGLLRVEVIRDFEGRPVSRFITTIDPTKVFSKFSKPLANTPESRDFKVLQFPVFKRNTQ